MRVLGEAELADAKGLSEDVLTSFVFLSIVFVANWAVPAKFFIVILRNKPGAKVTIGEDQKAI
jgi:hypothetical protein